MGEFSTNTALLFSVVIMFLTVYFSYRGFKDKVFFEKYLFRVDNILASKDYKRLLTSGFLHANWFHLIFNLYAFFSFSEALESQMGSGQFLMIYFLSLLGGSLFALYIHRNHGNYSAIGASGAICGLIFASVALFPGISIGLILIPAQIPGWLFALIFVAISIYGIKSNAGNIGHDAHLGGALTGTLVAIAMNPEIIFYNYIPILCLLTPTIIFLYFILAMPEILLINNSFSSRNDYMSKDEEYNLRKFNKQKDIDRILDKINEKGLDSLTSKEKELLDEF
ncbi:MAG: rhomboid family intramembrane serine protease [Sporocytophaga sp.]|uniref:rhomboid family intramembrane serine protease n=1 Tax=Sporocytophaga sp. TaxID=2231183 RepID=UPI001B241081|nr:rhomboid family intramembrane serine protease [Sporocytophaga sp.]MBO9698690.1 rhomboid family intramembrane serine protease [Sporocytophaga sp.]